MKRTLLVLFICASSLNASEQLVEKIINRTGKTISFSVDNRNYEIKPGGEVIVATTRVRAAQALEGKLPLRSRIVEYIRKK